MDVSFISATKVLPAVVPLLRENGRLVTLIKPQFEVGRGEVGSGGIVRDPDKHSRVIIEVNQAAAALGLLVRKVIESPIRGAEGNIEFLALYDNES
jgi:23S rRNA (cytidine1920-2'-O)/16S rRNA (cytidine1409-2'-O)-methyltransferase